MTNLYDYVKPPKHIVSEFKPNKFPLEPGKAIFSWNGALVSVTVTEKDIVILIDTKEESFKIGRDVKRSEDTWSLILHETIETTHNLLLNSAINLLSGLKSVRGHHVIQ